MRGGLPQCSGLSARSTFDRQEQSRLWWALTRSKAFAPGGVLTSVKGIYAPWRALRLSQGRLAKVLSLLDSVAPAALLLCALIALGPLTY